MRPSRSLGSGNAAQYQGGTQLPFLQTQFEAGLMVVHVEVPPPEPLVSGSQLPFWQMKFGPGLGVVHVDGASHGGTQFVPTHTQLEAGLGVVQPVVPPPPPLVGGTQTPLTQV